MAHGIYLDNSLTTRPSEQALAKMIPFFKTMWGVPSAPHKMGQELFPALEENYKAIYVLLGASVEDDFVFTSSSAEGVNQVIQSAYSEITRVTGKNQFLTSNIDEAPAIMAIHSLEEVSCVSKMAKANSRGFVSPEAILDAITPRTALVSLSWANGLTGVINPVAAIATICQERGIKLHLDATHILGKLYYELSDIAPDYITFGGDVLHAPKGTGGLYVKAGGKCRALIQGGNEQNGLHAGSFNMPAFVALGQAAKEALDARDLLCTEVARLRDRLESGIIAGFPEAIAVFQKEDRLPHCSTLIFPGVANEVMLYALNRKNVFASIGGGCFQQIGLILMASGIEENDAHSAISFSLSRETTEEEIEQAVEIIVECAKKLRNISHQLIRK
jgi:cysteine desulfurase